MCAPTRARSLQKTSDVEASRMLVQLDLETQSYHARADEGWRRLLAPDIHRAAYLDQLERVYGFEGPLEAAFAYTPHLELLLNVHERYRAGFVAQDLIALGMRPAEVAHLPQAMIAPFASPLEALGWMYVAERWTKLHDEVRRHLILRLPVARDALGYLTSSDGVVEARWQSLGRALDKNVRTARMIDDVVRGALAAFRAWDQWTARRETFGKLA